MLESQTTVGKHSQTEGANRNHPPDPVLASPPPEITAQIFSFACQVIPGRFYRQREPHPLSLGRVCKSWREFVWSTSELWTTVDIHLENTDVNCEQKWSVLHGWLTRTRGQDLDIHVEQTGQYFDPPEELLELLVEHSSQWRSLYLHIPLPWCGYLFHRAYNVDLFNLPRLTSFTYHNNLSLRRRFSTMSDFPLNLTMASNLRSVTIGGWVTNTTTEVIELPGDKITCLSLIDYSQTDLHRQFALFPNLTEAHISDVFPLDRSEHYTAVAHPRLSALHVSFHFMAYLKLILYSFTLPSLKPLGLYVVEEMDDDEFTAFPVYSLIERSQCKLTHLYLSFSIHNDAETTLFDLFYVLDTLEVLEIKNISETRMELGVALFGAFHPIQEFMTPLLPSLEEFSYEGPLSHDYLQTVLESMIPRTDGWDVVGLEKLRIRITDPEPKYLKKFTTNPSCLSDELRDNLVDLIRRGVFELYSYDGKTWTRNDDVGHLDFQG